MGTMDDPEPSHASSNEPSEVTRLAQPSDEPASALSRASLFLANDSTASANDSRATSPGGETDQLASSDDDELEVPLKDQQATSEGGAIAGPGPSSSSMKRPLSPSPPTASNDGGSAAASNVAPPAKKKRGRASIPLVSNSYYPPPFPHYTVTRATGKNTKTNRHVLSINPDVTDGMQSRWPQEHEYDPKNKQDGKINWYERQPKDEGRHELWLKTAGDKMAAKLGLSEEGPFFLALSITASLNVTRRRRRQVNFGSSSRSQRITFSSSTIRRLAPRINLVLTLTRSASPSRAFQ